MSRDVKVDKRRRIGDRERHKDGFFGPATTGVPELRATGHPLRGVFVHADMDGVGRKRSLDAFHCVQDRIVRISSEMRLRARRTHRNKQRGRHSYDAGTNPKPGPPQRHRAIIASKPILGSGSSRCRQPAVRGVGLGSLDGVGREDVRQPPWRERHPVAASALGAAIACTIVIVLKIIWFGGSWTHAAIVAVTIGVVLGGINLAILRLRRAQRAEQEQVDARWKERNG